MITNIFDIDNPTWQDDAACLRYGDPSLFFERGNGNSTKAKKICNTMCPVKQKCLDWTLRLEKKTVAARSGIYAGLTPNERSKIAVCKYGDCINRVKKHTDFCSPEHTEAYDAELKMNIKKSQLVSQHEYYKRGTLHKPS